MRLIDATAAFNDATAFDAYTGLELFKCNFTSYDDHAASGTTARRRVLFVPPSTVIPDRSCINLFGEIWIVGAGLADSYGGLVVRVAHGMKKSTDLAIFGTPAQTLLASGTSTAYLQRNFFKDSYNMLTESDSSIGWNVFMSPNETLANGSIILAGDGVTLRVRKTYLPVEGLRVAECDELDDNALQTAVFNTNSTYDPLTDSYGAASVSSPIFLVDYNRLYRLHTVADPIYQPGDLAVLVPQTALTVKTGMDFTMLGLKWRVLSVQAEIDCWLLHARIG